MATKQKKLRRTRSSRLRRLPTGPNGGIELLLIQSVEYLGNQGDIVEVKPGFAKNYLIPQGLATVASTHHKRMVEKHRERLEAIERARVADLKRFADMLGKQSVTIEANATEEGHLYGSVGAPEIVAALKKNDISLNADQIKLEGPLKELGLYTVNVRVSSQVEGDLKVWVVPMIGSDEKN